MTPYRHECHVTKHFDSWDVKEPHAIVLLVSEVNNIYKHIGREAMIVAIDHGQIYPEQYSNSQRSAVAHGINRRLVFDYQRYLWQNFSLACSDLKSWYDRIVYSAAILVFKRLGITLPEIISMLDKIQYMSHMVRAAYGDSNITYRGDTMPHKFRHFMMGRFQRNGVAPQIWSIISSLVLLELRAQRFGIHFANYSTTKNNI